MKNNNLSLRLFFETKKESEWNLLHHDQQDQLLKEYEGWLSGFDNSKVLKGDDFLREQFTDGYNQFNLTFETVATLLDDFAALPKTDFRSASIPLIKYLAENHHPHVTAIVTSNRAELLEGKESIVTDEFIVD